MISVVQKYPKVILKIKSKDTLLSYLVIHVDSIWLKALILNYQKHK